MSEWTWTTGEVKGKCGGCDKILWRSEILVTWREQTYHVGCLLEILTALAPKPNPYLIPGANWQAP